MARVSSTAASTLGTGVSNPSIQNVTVTANIETAIVIPTGSRIFRIRHRASSKFTIRYTILAADYFTNMPGNVYVRENLAPTGSYTVYVTPEKDGVLEVESWS